MEKEEYRNIFNNEETHFYYVATHSLIIDLVKQYAPQKKDMMILDAGCGTGLLGVKLQSLGKVKGVDISETALAFARKRGLEVYKSDVCRLPFKKNSFDVIVSIDVLYHKRVFDDIRALKEFYRVLKPGGIAIVRVPALKWLKRSHDKIVHSRKRYEKNELQYKLQVVGFVIQKLSFVHATLLPVVILSYMVERLLTAQMSTSSITKLPKSINQFLKVLLYVESIVLQYFNLPFGIGVIAVARKS